MRKLRLLALAGAAGVAIVVATSLGLVMRYSHDLPDHRELANYQPPTTTRVHAGDGRLIAEFATEKRVFVPMSAIPKRVAHAFVSAEDQNFYTHSGVDWLATARAMVGNLQKYVEDRRPVGASGITQQVARMFFLNNEVSYGRKIREAILAYRIESALPKDRILELYLNEIFLGNRSYGVAAAALNYFDKALDELTVAECAFLASLPKAPDRYFRDRFREAALARRNWVIQRMAEDGYITPDEAKAATAEPLQFRERRRDEFFAGADYYVEEVRRELGQVYGEKTLYEGGLSVRTSLNPHLQELAQRALRNGLMAYDRRDGWRGPVTHLEGVADWKDRLAKLPVPPGGEAWHMAAVLAVDAQAAKIGLADGTQGAIPLSELKWARRFKPGEGSGPAVQKPADALAVGDVVLVEPLTGKEAPAGAYALRQIPEVQGALVALDPHTGRVLAMQGGFSGRISVFNRVSQANRQPGSAFKPFVYLAAMDHGFTPSSMVLDAPFTLSQEGQGKWRPSNYGEKFYGPTPLRVGIEKSRNLMTVRLAQNIGMEPVVDIARKFGIYDNLPPELSMALGAGETTLLRLTTAYAMLVNGGRKIEPTIVDRVQDREGRTIYRHDTRPCDGCQAFVAVPPAPAGAAPVPAADAGQPAGPGTAQAAEPPAAPVPAVLSPENMPVVPDNREQVDDPRTIYQVVAMMEGVVQRGTAARLRDLGRPLAGKTGTTNDSNDAWFIGFSPDLVAGVYVGFDTPRSLGDHETGASVSVPIFKEFMGEALAGQPATPFRVPPGLRLVRVDPETGRLADAGARNAIWEPFLPGTEPTGEEGVLDGSAESGDYAADPQRVSEPGAPAAAPPSLGSGTGGVY
jgi:penicillin-binding protein 1A